MKVDAEDIIAVLCDYKGFSEWWDDIYSLDQSAILKKINDTLCEDDE
jgi:hypothetical protein